MNKIVKGILIAGLALAGTMVSTTVVGATVVGPDGCSDDTPYNCAMSRKKFDQLVGSWCALAKPDKQGECKLSFFTYVHTSPSAVKTNANFTIPSYCKLDFDRTSEQQKNLPDFCYVIAKQPSAYYNATKKIIEECGVAENQDQLCARRLKQQFLYDKNKSWADKPDTASTTNTGVNTSTKAADTPFIQRMNLYIKWFTAGLGILAVFGLVIAGIQYTAAGDNPQAVSDAKKRISNIVIGILIYVFMFGLLQWLIPGGLFSS